MNRNRIREALAELTAKVEDSLNAASMGDYDVGAAADADATDLTEEIIDAFDELLDKADNFERAFLAERRLRLEGLDRLGNVIAEIKGGS